MSSSKKKTLGRLGVPPSRRRTASTLPAIGGFCFPVPAAQVLDIPRISGVWEEWHRSGVIDRPWNLKAYLEVLAHFLREGLIDWSGLEEMKPAVRAVLGRVRAGEMTPGDFQSSIDRTCRDHEG